MVKKEKAICLKCQKEFKSANKKTNRICERCKTANSAIAEYGTVPAISRYQKHHSKLYPL